MINLNVNYQAVHELIVSRIQRHISLDPHGRDYFTSLLKSRVVKRKEYLLIEGQPCKTINYVNRGALRAFYRGPDAKEATMMFAINDWWITDMPCFIKQSAAMISIEAIEDSDVWQLSKDDLDELFIQVPAFERFFRILMQNAYVREQLRTLENLSLPAAERYQNFLKKYPSIAQQVAQKDIASYLGITPEFLSAIRAKRSLS
jgi:CRP-like cAMP-binding protein